MAPSQAIARGVHPEAVFDELQPVAMTPRTSDTASTDAPRR
jgi:hypothetical protein